MPFLKNEAVTVMRHFHLNLCDRVESYSAVKLRALPSLNHNVNKATKATAMAAIYGAGCACGLGSRVRRDRARVWGGARPGFSRHASGATSSDHLTL